MKVTTLDLQAHLADHGARHLLLAMDYLVDGERVTSNLTHFVRPKHVSLQEPGIRMSVAPRDAQHAVVTLTADKPALWTWLAMDGVALRCSENYVHLMPGVPVTIEVRADGDAQWQALRVYSLVDTYRPAGVPVATA